MKKVLFFAIAAMMVTTSLAAQENGGGRQGFQRPDQATMIKMRTERMVKELGLNETQEAKLLELNQKYPNMMMGPGMGGPGGPGMGRPSRGRDNEEVAAGEAEKDAKAAKKAKKAKKAQKEEQVRPDDPRKAMQEAREAYMNELKGILTEEQFKTYQENMNKRPEGRGPGGPGGPGRGGFGGGERGGFGQGFGGGDNW